MRPRKRPRGCRRHLVLMLLPVLFLVGCWDRHDPEKMAWVMSIGIDRGPRNDYIFSFQLPVTKPSPGGGGAPGGQSKAPSGGGTDVFAVEAPDVITALDLAQSFVARRVSLTQAKAVILGEELARTDVTPVIGQATRYYGFRRNTNLMVCRCKAYDFVRRAQPQLEANPSRWYELLMQTQAQAGIIPETRINEFTMEAETPGLGAKATLVAIRPDVAVDTAELGSPGEGEETGKAPPTAGSSMAGNARRRGEIPVEFLGAAIFKGTKLRGYLTGDEARFVSMLRGDFKHASMAFVDPNSPDRRVVILIELQKSPDVRVTWQGMKVHVEFNVALEGDVASIQSLAEYSQPAKLGSLQTAVARELEQRMSKMVDKTLHQWGTDLYRINNRLKPFFPTMAAWEQFNWSKRVPDTDFAVHVKFRARRFGMQTAPTKPTE